MAIAAAGSGGPAGTGAIERIAGTGATIGAGVIVPVVVASTAVSLAVSRNGIEDAANDTTAAAARPA
ncbi:hypothetical protein D3C83_194110 [compost metagenome]